MVPNVLLQKVQLLVWWLWLSPAFLVNLSFLFLTFCVWVELNCLLFPLAFLHVSSYIRSHPRRALPWNTTHMRILSAKDKVQKSLPPMRPLRPLREYSCLLLQHLREILRNLSLSSLQNESGSYWMQLWTLQVRLFVFILSHCHFLDTVVESAWTIRNKTIANTAGCSLYQSSSGKAERADAFTASAPSSSSTQA